MLFRISTKIASFTRVTLKSSQIASSFWRQSGCQMVWLIYPDKKMVEVYHSDADIDILMADEMLLGYDVLPNFELPVREIFV